MDTTVPTNLPSQFIDDLADEMERAKATNWQDILEDISLDLSIEHLPDRELTQADKDALSNLLIQRLVQAVKEKQIAEADVQSIASYIASYLERMTVESSMKDFLYLLQQKWPIFSDIPTLLYQQPVNSRDAIEQLAAKGDQ